MLESGRETILAVSIVATLLFGFFILFIILIVISFQKRRVLAEMQRREEESRVQLELSRKANEVREQTLHYVARELHDGVSQLLGVALLYLQPGDSKKDNTASEKVRGILLQALSETRAVSKGLHAGLVSEGHIQDAMREQLDQLQQAGSFETHLHCTIKDWSWDFDKQLLLFRIFQELIQNAIKHSKATTLNVTLIGAGDYTQLIVEDNGVGFNTGEVRLGMGIKNLKERADMLQLTMSVDSEAGRGTRIRFVSEMQG